MDLNREKLHAFLSMKAKAGVTVSLKEVADHFGVTDGAGVDLLPWTG
jgi:hypothetical protein